jgi:hypothetical protein
MRALMGWLAKSYFFPLLPFAVGALIRYFYLGGPSWEIIDPRELSFSMAISYVLVFSSVSRLQDIALRESLTTLCVYGLCAFLAMFGCASEILMNTQSGINQNLQQLKSLVQSGSTPSQTLFDRVTTMPPDLIPLMTLRHWVTVLSIATLPLFVFLKRRYDLEN